MAKTVELTPDGVEIGVETGYGNVTKVELPEGKQNAHVEINADNLRLPVKGWADSTNPEIWEAVQDALNTGRRIAFRIEIHRDRHAPQDIPLAEVDKFARFRRLVSVKPAGGSMAQQENGHEERPVVSDYDPGPTEPAEPRGSRIQEGKPWERTNSDGSPNLGSYAFLAAVGTVEWAYALLSARRAEKGHSGPPTLHQVEAMAAMLLDASDRAQSAVRADGRVDRMDASHTRARGAVRCIVDADGVPWADIAQPAGRAPWVASVAASATALLEMAKELDR